MAKQRGRLLKNGGSTLSPEAVRVMERAGKALELVAARCQNRLTPETFKQVLDASVEVNEAIRDAKAGRPVYMGLNNGN